MDEEIIQVLYTSLWIPMPHAIKFLAKMMPFDNAVSLMETNIKESINTNNTPREKILQHEEAYPILYVCAKFRVEIAWLYKRYQELVSWQTFKFKVIHHINIGFQIMKSLLLSTNKLPEDLCNLIYSKKIYPKHFSPDDCRVHFNDTMVDLFYNKINMEELNRTIDFAECNKKHKQKEFK